ncbi:heparin lyase I family protein [Pseudovibrio brasiliensis]|uniref:Heparin lyase I family protein n=1 Tax=Pseudovibrio brasiliensis TaxID=1898042 RepID=A0ABX8ARC1_9HYPH|nr:heparin lyase I family protein [Pseudovibrio brasiliensis]QUS57578.1 heparin lyase I family protein [Pseudovibrio brasiliensis]
MPGSDRHQTIRKHSLLISALAGVSLLILPTAVTANDRTPTYEPSEKQDVIVTPEQGGGLHVDQMRQTKCAVIIDDFDEYPSPENWDIHRMNKPENFQIESEVVRDGGHALAITVFGDDELDSEGNLKNELWEARQKRCDFGDEVWYSFSFKIDGTVWPAGSTRWVIGQWKEDSGGSPFLAQRFDNGVFHITVQHNDTRKLVAQAEGSYQQDFKGFSREFQQMLSLDRQGFRNRNDATRTSDEFLGSGLTLEELKKAIETQDTSKFPFLADPQTYSDYPGIKIELSDDPVLPDPTDGWVDMRYRVKGSRVGQGIIEIWANDRFIARVTGYIGNDEFAGNTQYFKFGHYRDYDRDDLQSTVYLDRFRRGPHRSDVD